MPVMVVLVIGLGTSCGDSDAPADLCLGRFGAMVLLLLPTNCLPMYGLTERYLLVLLVMDALVLLLLSHLG